MNRRTFFLTAAAAAASAPAAQRVRIGFLGAAHSHAEAKIKTVRDSPNFELAGVFETDLAIRSALEKTGVRMLTLDQLLGDKSIAVVAIESAVEPHAAHARLALEAGKHVHIEKPPSYKRGDLEKLVELAARKKLLMQMGYMWRYHPAMNAALEAARQGWLGEIYHVRGTINTLIPVERRPDWNLFKGGQMFEQGAHLIDPLIRLLGRPSHVTPFLKSHGGFDDRLADNTVAVFEFPKALGVITSSILQPNANPHRSFEILWIQWNGCAQTDRAGYAANRSG